MRFPRDYDPIVLLVYPAPLLLRDSARTDPASPGHTVLVDDGIVRQESQLTITRQSTDDVGFREIFVSLDGTRLGILRYGDELTVDITPGPHEIRAHNTLFWKTHRVVAKPGEHVRFTAINRAGWGTFGMLFVLGAMPVYLTFERVVTGK